MKEKIVRNRRAGTEQLVLKTGKGETLDYAQAECLRTASSNRLLPFCYETGRRDATQLAFDITDTVPLDTYLKAALSLSQFHALLDDVVDSFEVCGRLGLDPGRMLCDPAHVRLDANGNRVSFAYLPVQGLASDRATTMDLLRHIAERASFVCEEDQREADALLDYLKRQTVFSAVEFKEFVRGGAANASANRAAGENKAEESGKTTLKATYDFVRSQSGSLSVEEIRARRTFAESVAADVGAAPKTQRASDADFSAPTGSTAPTDAVAQPSAAAQRDAAKPLPAEAAAPPCDADPAPHATMLLGSETGGQRQQAAEAPQLVRLADNTRYPVRPCGQTVVGRSRSCEISIDGNPNVSRRHVTLEVRDGVCFVTDEGALNRTYVDGEPLDPHVRVPLAQGSILRLADEEFRLD